jgi:hypothetical protein
MAQKAAVNRLLWRCFSPCPRRYFVWYATGQKCAVILIDDTTKHKKRQGGYDMKSRVYTLDKR